MVKMFSENELNRSRRFCANLVYGALYFVYSQIFVVNQNQDFGLTEPQNDIQQFKSQSRNVYDHYNTLCLYYSTGLRVRVKYTIPWHILKQRWQPLPVSLKASLLANSCQLEL